MQAFGKCLACFCDRDNRFQALIWASLNLFRPWAAFNWPFCLVFTLSIDFCFSSSCCIFSEFLKASSTVIYIKICFTVGILHFFLNLDKFTFPLYGKFRAARIHEFAATCSLLRRHPVIEGRYISALLNIIPCTSDLYTTILCFLVRIHNALIFLPISLIFSTFRLPFYQIFD